jgi:hypothetical protein
MLGTTSSISDGLARSFSRLGWIGFWLQIAIGSIPFALLIYAFLFGKDGIGTRSSFVLLEYLSIGSLLLLAFTTVWFYRYTRLGRRSAAPDRRPSVSSVHRLAWIGVAASMVSIVFSALVMMFEVTQLLFYFLRAPQAGVPVFQTTSGGPASWVSASDILGLMGLIFTMLIEVIVLALGLWLLFRSTAELAEIHTPDDEDLTADLA